MFSKSVDDADSSSGILGGKFGMIEPNIFRSAFYIFFLNFVELLGEFSNEILSHASNW